MEIDVWRIPSKQFTLHPYFEGLFHPSYGVAVEDNENIEIDMMCSNCILCPWPSIFGGGPISVPIYGTCEK